jgi:hypothetical protein
VVVDRENPSTSFAGVAPSRRRWTISIKGERGGSLDVEIRAMTAVPTCTSTASTTARSSPDSPIASAASAAPPSSQDYVISVVPAGGARYELMVTMR